jgi:hypothetical protein
MLVSLNKVVAYPVRSGIGIVVNLAVMTYVLNMERDQCQCSVDWRRDYIKYFSIISVLSILFKAFINSGKLAATLPKLISIGLPVLMAIGGIVYIYSMLSYAIKMRDNKCGCSEHSTREFMYWYIMAIILSSVLVVITRMVVVMDGSVKIKK